jgi:hypothetical protein
VRTCAHTTNTCFLFLTVGWWLKSATLPLSGREVHAPHVTTLCSLLFLMHVVFRAKKGGKAAGAFRFTNLCFVRSIVSLALTSVAVQPCPNPSQSTAHLRALKLAIDHRSVPTERMFVLHATYLSSSDFGPRHWRAARLEPCLCGPPPCRFKYPPPSMMFCPHPQPAPLCGAGTPARACSHSQLPVGADRHACSHVGGPPRRPQTACCMPRRTAPPQIGRLYTTLPAAAPPAIPCLHYQCNRGCHNAPAPSAHICYYLLPSTPLHDYMLYAPGHAWRHSKHTHAPAPLFPCRMLNTTHLCVCRSAS